MTAYSYLEAESFHQHRLQGYMNAIVTDAFPIILLLEESAVQERIPLLWLTDVANKFTDLCGQLSESFQTDASESRNACLTILCIYQY